MSQIFIETPRLILRQWHQGDLEPYIRLNQDAEVMEFFPAIQTPGETTAQMERLKNHILEHGFGFLAVERKDNGQFIGFTGLAIAKFESPFTPCTEIGWRLSKENWGQGFATEGAKACLKFGFDKLILDEIYAFTSIHNNRSENVMKKIGMHKEGNFDHPNVAVGHFVKPHVYYKVNKE